MKSIFKIIPFVLGIVLVISSCRKDEVENISLSETQKNMLVGETFSLNTYISATGSISKFPVTYRTDNSNVATVDQAGLVTAKNVGKATISVSAGNKTAYCVVTVDKSLLQFTSGVQNYWGDYFRMKTHAYDLYLLSKELSIDSKGDIVGNGVFIYLDINTPNDKFIIPSGKYSANRKGHPYTFVDGYTEKNDKDEKVIKGSYLGVVENSITTTKILIQQGNLDFTLSNNQYNLVGTIITEYNTEYEILFKGEIPMSDFVTPMPENLKQGKIEFWGDIDKDNANKDNAKLFNIKLGDSSVNMNDFSGGLDKLVFEVGVPMSASNIEIPDGTYPVQNQQIVVQNYTLGGFKDKDGNNFGSWYYTGDEFRLTKGSVKISKNATFYTLEYELEDDYFGYKIAGSFVGELVYSDMTKTSSASAMSKMARAQRISKNQLTKTTAKTTNTSVRVKNQR